MWPFLNNVTTTCGCTHCTPSTSICYTGVNLSCIGVNKNDTLSVALQKINALMCVPLTNSEIITALGYTPANDSNVVHKTGDETIAGNKIFTSNINTTSLKLYDDTNTGYSTISIDDGTIYFKDSADVNISNINTNGINFGTSNISLQNVTISRTWQLPDTSGTIALVETIRPYKVYTALLTQTGTSAPVATVLENVLDDTLLFSYVSPGLYLVELNIGSSPLLLNVMSPQSKIAYIKTGFEGSPVFCFYITLIDGYSFYLNTEINDMSDDNLFQNTYVEFRVYN